MSIEQQLIANGEKLAAASRAVEAARVAINDKMRIAGGLTEADWQRLDHATSHYQQVLVADQALIAAFLGPA